MSRMMNTGEVFTQRQRKMQAHEHARHNFKDTYDLFYIVDILHNKWPYEEDWVPKSSVLEQTLYMANPTTVKMRLEVLPAVGERGAVSMEVDLVKLMFDLPRNLIGCMCQYDPPTGPDVDKTPLDVCAYNLTYQTDFLTYMVNIAELFLIISQMLIFVHERRADCKMSGADWLCFRRLLLQNETQEGQPAAILGLCIDSLHACLTMFLGKHRREFQNDLASLSTDYNLPQGEKPNPERARKRLRMIMCLLLATEKLCLISAMEEQYVTMFSRLPVPTTDHVFHHFFKNQSQAIPCLTKMLRACSLLFQTIRERCFQFHTPVEHDCQGRFCKRPACKTSNVLQTRKFALLFALILEPLERLVQCRPMKSVLANLGEDNITLEVLKLAQAGMAALAPDPDVHDRVLYSQAFCISANEHAGRPHVATSCMSGDMELLVARAHMLCAHVTSCIAPALRHIGELRNDGTAWWEQDLPKWFDVWMGCAYFSMGLASSVLTRKFPTDEKEFPYPVQMYEGQLSINVMRAASAFCQSACPALVNSEADEQCPYYKVNGKFQLLAVALRSRITVSTPVLKDMWGCGEMVRNLFAKSSDGNEMFRVAPVSSKFRDAYGELCCFEGTDMRPYIKRRFAAMESVTDNPKGRRFRAKIRPQDEEAVTLQALEMSVHAWRILQGMVSMQMDDGTPFHRTKLAQLMESAIVWMVKGQKTAHEVWSRVVPRLTDNVQILADWAIQVEQCTNQDNPDEALIKKAMIEDVVKHFLTFLQSKLDE